MTELHPPVRIVQDAVEIVVQLEPTPAKADCFDLTFNDGQFATEGPSEMFPVLREDANGSRTTATTHA